jgi:hypothetical protein
MDLKCFYLLPLLCILINAQVAVPTGIQLPSALIGQVVPTANPYLPNRPENLPPTATPTAKASKDAGYFILKDFLIVLGSVLGFIMFVVVVLIGMRCIKGEPDLTKQWEKETEELAQRTAYGATKNKKLWKARKSNVTKESDFKLQFQSE